MRASLRRLPIRWQITVLHATILTLVLLSIGVLLYTQQRSFLFMSAATRLRAQARPLIDAGLGAQPNPAPPPRPPEADPLPKPELDPPLRQTLATLAEALASRDTAAQVLELDGTLLARGTHGPPTPAPPPERTALERAARGALEERFIASVGNERMLAVLIPLWQNGRVIALAELSTPATPIDDVLRRLALYLSLGLALALALVTILGVSATRRVLQPLEQMVATTRAIAAGDLSQRLSLPPGTTEIAQLGASFDTMVARLEAAFAAQRRFVADAAHELRTPLSALSGSVELLRIGASADDPAKTERLLRHLDTELSRVIRLTNDLLTLSTLDAQPQLALRPLDLSALLGDIAEDSQTLLTQTLDSAIAPDLWIQGNADRLRQVLLNLIDNARKYTPADGRISIRAEADAQTVHVLVGDTGSGIPAAAIPKLFDRFYRVDSARTRQSGGSGLGLAIAQAIVQAHGGSIAIESAQGQGTNVSLLLPRLETSTNLQNSVGKALTSPATLNTSK
jgi:signal transduction histidine kinase